MWPIDSLFSELTSDFFSSFFFYFYFSLSLCSSFRGGRELLRQRLSPRQDGGGAWRPEAVWALQRALPQRSAPSQCLLFRLWVYLSACKDWNMTLSSLQCVKAPGPNTDRLWTRATSTASSTAPRFRAASTSWSPGSWGNVWSWLQSLRAQWHTCSYIFLVFILHRDPFKNIPPLDAKKLEVFRTVREITGVCFLFLHLLF